jgi:hypothetical protein
MIAQLQAFMCCLVAARAQGSPAARAAFALSGSGGSEAYHERFIQRFDQIALLFPHLAVHQFVEGSATLSRLRRVCQRQLY